MVYRHSGRQNTHGCKIKYVALLSGLPHTVHFLFSSIYLQSPCSLQLNAISIVFMYHIFLSSCQLKVINYFYFLPIMNRAAMNMAEQVSVEVGVESFGHRPRSGIVWSFAFTEF